MKFIRVLESINEKEFPKYILTSGFQCIRYNRRSYSKIKQVLSELIKTITNSNDAKELLQLCYYSHLLESILFDISTGWSIGKPDFIIWNTNEYFFCEFKSPGDSLSINQLMWFTLHQDINSAIAFVK